MPMLCLCFFLFLRWLTTSHVHALGLPQSFSRSCPVASAVLFIECCMCIVWLARRAYVVFGCNLPRLCLFVLVFVLAVAFICDIIVDLPRCMCLRLCMRAHAYRVRLICLHIVCALYAYASVLSVFIFVCVCVHGSSPYFACVLVYWIPNILRLVLRFGLRLRLHLYDTRRRCLPRVASLCVCILVLVFVRIFL